jgi:hypothetical protein
MPERLPLPRFYLPRPLVERRRELLGLLPGAWPVHDTLRRHGPDGDPEVEGSGGGQVVGGTWQPDDEGWQQTSRGYWIDWHAGDPSAFLRDLPLPGWLVRGTLPGHAWLVPRLALPVEGAVVIAGDLARAGWTTEHLVDALAPLDRAVSLLESLEVGTRSMPDEWETSCLEAAWTVLRVNYAMPALEDAQLAGWLSTRLAIEVVAAAVRLVPRAPELPPAELPDPAAETAELPPADEEGGG